MKKGLLAVVVVAVAAGVAYYYMRADSAAANPDAAARAAGRGSGGGGFGGYGGFGGFGGFGGGGGGPRMPMTVELAPVKRGSMSETLTVVGNLIGEATVEAVPKVSGRLDAVYVRLGDRVTRGQRLAKVEDRELQEQIKQAQASYEVSAATIRQREADLRLAQTNLDRSKNLHDRDLIPKQTFDDTDARHQAALAQLDLARAQFTQAKARLDELEITLSNTEVVSPVSGFIGKRSLDPGAWVSPNSAFISVVDIGTVRMVANVVEKDLRRVSQGLKASVSVDAFPGEQFNGRVARVAPVLDPTTRTAQIEVEIPNQQFRLKPGMYATVHFTVEQRDNVLILPANAVVDQGGKKGVFLPGEGDVAKFQVVTLGMVQPTQVELVDGLTEGTSVITTGAASLREGDRIVLFGRGDGRQRGQGGAGRGPVPPVPVDGGAARGARGAASTSGRQ
jgi:RND family efflux transporter MFP subunit